MYLSLHVLFGSLLPTIFEWIILHQADIDVVFKKPVELIAEALKR